MKIKLTIAAAAMLAASLTASMANAAAVDVGTGLGITGKSPSGLVYTSDIFGYSSFLNALSKFSYNDLSSYFGATANVVKKVSGFEGEDDYWLAKLTFNGTSVSSNGYVVNTTANTVSPVAVAVPGPEAGTGLAAVAMAGLGVLAYRRKQKLAA